MQKTIYNKYDKTLIAQLPLVQFEGRIVVVLNASEAERAVKFLLTQPMLGFDTETRPNFKRGHLYKVSLLQVATEDICFLFRLNYTGLTPAIVQLLEDTTVTKVALSWHDDVNSLHFLGPFQTGTFIDIQHHVKDVGIEDLSLQKIYANLFGQKISKRQQLTNWEADVLSEKQKLYAATDAWACISIYKELLRLKSSGDYVLVKNDE
jgi:ribonuclease D